MSKVELFRWASCAEWLPCNSQQRSSKLHSALGRAQASYPKTFHETRWQRSAWWKFLYLKSFSTSPGEAGTRRNLQQDWAFAIWCKIKMHIWTQNLLWLFKPRMNSWPVQKRLTPLGHGGHPNVNMSHLEVTHAFQQLLHMINQENGKQSFLAVRKWWKFSTPKLLAFFVKDPNWSIKPYSSSGFPWISSVFPFSFIFVWLGVICSTFGEKSLQCAKPETKLDT